MPSMRAAVSDYLDLKGSQSRATREQYRHILQGSWLPWCDANGIKEPKQATDVVMGRFAAFLAEREHNGHPLATETRRTYLRVTRLMLTVQKVDRGAFKMPQKPKHLRRDVLTRDEVDRLEKAAISERDALIVRVLGDTGLRLGELLALRLEDLEEDSHARKHRLFIRAAKRDKDRRVPLTPELFKRLRAFAQGTAAQGFIFAAKRRRAGADKLERLTRSGADQLLKSLADRAKLGKKLNAHLLRHGFITNQLLAKTPIPAIQKVVGHSSPELILEVYENLDEEEKFDLVLEGLKRK